MNTGELVRIKSYEAILAMKIGMVSKKGSFCVPNIMREDGTTYFNFNMKRFCGTVVTLHAALGPPCFGDWKVRENHFFWNESWLVPASHLQDELFEI